VLTLRRVVLYASLCAASCGPPTYDYSKEPDPRRLEFVVGVSDGLKITVWKNAELSTEARVRPDGTITMPLIGDIRASGKTPSQIKSDITKRLATYVKDDSAIVSVAVTEVNSYRFTVSGNVEHGGIYNSKSFVTVAEAIAMAGGLNKYASAAKVVIVRNDDKGQRRIPIDYNRVASGEHPEENLALIAGDTVFVP
jgi:polysaccharide export outer membrane protein